MASLSLSSAPHTSPPSCSEKTLSKNCPSGVMQNAVLVSNELMMIVCEDGKLFRKEEKSKETQRTKSGAPSLFSYLTMDELLFNLKSYILKHRLYDPLDPRKILVHGSELGSLLGLSEFSLVEVRGILLGKFVFPVTQNTEVSSEVICSISEKVCVSKKRKLEDDSEFSAKKFFNGGESSDDRESMHSLQDYETELAKDSTSDGDNFSLNGLIIAETFDVDVEYEIQTDSEYSYESDSDLENFVKSAIISFIADAADSDIEYLADASSDDNESEKELFEEDKWLCLACGYRNDSPYVRKCASCWETRNGWLSERERSKTIYKRKESGTRKKKQKKSYKNKASSKKDGKLLSDLPCTTKTEGLNSTSSPCNDSSDVILLSQSSTNTLEADKNTKLCIFCCENTADCSILHGNSACKICCFKCGDKLKGSTQKSTCKRARCPNCRRIIERIVFLYNL